MLKFNLLLNRHDIVCVLPAS